LDRVGVRSAGNHVGDGYDLSFPDNLCYRYLKNAVAEPAKK